MVCFISGGLEGEGGGEGGTAARLKTLPFNIIYC